MLLYVCFPRFSSRAIPCIQSSGSKLTSDSRFILVGQAVSPVKQQRTTSSAV